MSANFHFPFEIFTLIVVNVETIKVKRDWTNESPTDSNLIKYYYNCIRFISNVKLQLHNGNAPTRKNIIKTLNFNVLYNFS